MCALVTGVQTCALPICIWIAWKSCPKIAGKRADVGPIFKLEGSDPLVNDGLTKINPYPPNKRISLALDWNLEAAPNKETLSIHDAIISASVHYTWTIRGGHPLRN